MPRRDQIVIRSAFVWNCNECSHKNFGEYVHVDLDPDEQAAILDSLEYDPNSCSDNMGDRKARVSMLGRPEVVACGRCGVVFDIFPENFEDGE